MPFCHRNSQKNNPSRLFGIVKLQTFEVLDVTMVLRWNHQPGVSDPEVEQMVHEKVDLFWKSIKNGGSKRGQILVTFSEERQKKGGWFVYSGGEEEVPWEQWVINAEIRQPLDRDRLIFDSTLAATLTKSIQTMLTHTSSERGRSVVPPITHNGISPFPFKLAVKMGSIEIG
ncbi:hypothetical protein ARMSODRAFT_988111 [Armillaria solidipes]|uniref:Autophagy-related protein 101 n=1 Tax=Armillaria solidipes TaxID=1076256 RepID=A0A2H3C1W9_9AGAR|nr:hypothetical protein ARMSODRAFT_988111 [Armillaria solidipes]